APIRALIGQFDDVPGLGLAVVDSGSNDLTYYSDFLSDATAPRFIPTGGILPVAARMGDYNHDGYSHLFVAPGADDRITLFEGGPSGLVLAGTFSVGQSVQPTDLAVSTDPSGTLQIYVAAEGSDRAILVNVTLGVASPIAGAAGGYPAPPA